MNLKSLLPGFLAGVLVLIAFFLPWARPVPKELERDVGRVQQHLLEETNLWNHYLYMSSHQSEQLHQGMVEGFSGWQIAFAPPAPNEAGSLRDMLYLDLVGNEYAEGVDRSPELRRAGVVMKCLLIFPFLALFNLFFVLRPSKWGLFSCTSLDILLYIFTRWKMNQMFVLGNFIFLSVGFWLALYGLLLLALTCVWSYYSSGTGGGRAKTARKKKK